VRATCWNATKPLAARQQPKAAALKRASTKTTRNRDLRFGRLEPGILKRHQNLPWRDENQN